MAAQSGSLFNLHQDRIEEVINKNIDVLLPGLDPVWMDTIVSSQGVGPADAIGRDMHILRVFQGGMTGVLEQAKPRNDFPLYGDDTDTVGTRIHEQNLVQTFPDPTDGPNQSPFRLAIPMRAMVSNIMFTLGEITAEAQDAFIGQIIAPKLTGFAMNIGQTLCNAWYVSQNTSYRLCTADNPVVTDTSGGAPYYITFNPDNEACDRFYRGMRVDWWDATVADRKNDTNTGFSGQTPSTRVQLYVDNVDELTNTVRLVSNTDPDSWVGHEAGTEGPLADEPIFHANSAHDDSGATFTNIAGARSWMKTGAESNTNLMGAESISGDAIDVTTVTEHKSMGYGLSNQLLTEHTMRQILRRFHAAKNKYGYYVDCLIASDGVWMGYESTKIGRETIDRTNRISSLKAEGSAYDRNFGGFSFTMDGRTYMGYTSTYIENGTCYGIRKGGGNWKRYVPRDGSINATFNQAAPFIPFRFVAKNLGASGNMLPIYLTNAAASGDTINKVTEGVQMPGWLRMQLVPDQFCGIILDSIQEDRIYADQ